MVASSDADLPLVVTCEDDAGLQECPKLGFLVVSVTFTLVGDFFFMCAVTRFFRSVPFYGE